MELDLDSSEQTTDFVTVPAGTYLCRIAEIRERQSRAGDTLWGMRLVVAEGEFIGRLAAWDNLVFSNRGLVRVKLVLRALGLPADGKIDLKPEDLTDRQVFAEVRPAEYHSPEGIMTRRNEIPYDGYRSFAGDREADAGSPEEVDPLPF